MVRKMKNKQLEPAMTGVLLLAGMLLVGCGTVAESNSRDTRRQLSRAGFKKLEADTPEKLAHLKTLDQLEVNRAQRGGKTFYYYADAINSKSLYVGKVVNYQRYVGTDVHGNTAQSHHDEAVNEAVDLNMMATESWNAWGPWMGWW